MAHMSANEDRLREPVILSGHIQTERDSMRYWLMKSEPDEFSIDDLAAAKNKTTAWFGVRNYQARNFMRDQMKVGDRVFFYHSSCPEPASQASPRCRRRLIRTRRSSTRRVRTTTRSRPARHRAG
jgi:hypothetical protein